MEKIVVLVHGQWREKIFSPKYFERLQKSGEVKVYDRVDFADKDYVVDFVKGATVIVTSWDSPVLDKEILDACPDLKAVLHAAGSIKSVISDEFVARKIRITNSACAIGEGVAETALGFALASCKGFWTFNEDIHNGTWKRDNWTDYVKDFYDITVGVISGGFVGKHMVKLLKSFHVDILMYDPILTEEQIATIGAKKVSLEELMSTSDVVTIHAPSIPATDNMINASNLKLMKDKAILINTARGSIINQDDLIEELKKNRILACLDVFTPEPLPADSELTKLPNAILTPHIAGICTNGFRRLSLHVCEEIERLIAGEKMKAEVNLDNLSKLA